MHPRLTSIYNTGAFFAHAFLDRARHGFYEKGYYEPIYRALFLREIARLGIDDSYYPIGGAANHSLLYLLTRIIGQFSIERTLEFGCGQTSFLIDEVRKKTGSPDVAWAVESDTFWAEKVSGRIGGRVIQAPLVKRRVCDRECWTYDLGELRPDDKFDLFVVDGPAGSTRYSRFGSLEVIERHLNRDFIVIFDDAERIGEVDTVRACRALLREKGVVFFEKVFSAATQQHVFFSDRYREVASF